MEYISRDCFEDILIKICDTVCQNEKKLCELDSYVGDGDHGTTMARGFRAVKEKLLACPGSEISSMLNIAAEALESAMGGAIGPIFASLFEAAGEACEGKTEIGTQEWAQMLSQGCEAVMDLGGAVPGDRTMVDALSPAAQEAMRAAEENCALPEAMQRTARAAEEGAQETAHMIAKKGRAKFLGEKSKGHCDAGATSLSLVLRAVADEVAPKS